MLVLVALRGEPLLLEEVVLRKPAAEIRREWVPEERALRDSLNDARWAAR